MAESPSRTDDAKFGEAPLAQTVAAAGAMRRLSSLLVSLEHPHPTVDVMLAKFDEWESELAAAAPADSAPRIGEVDGDPRRVYLSHATDIGAYNPCFPEYSFDSLAAENAGGRIAFPVVYEGPPGFVHGGFLAVFFDAIIQHHNCATGMSGKTRGLSVTYRRPTPLLTELRFDIARSQGERGIASTARLLLDDEVLCTGEVNTLASTPDKLAGNEIWQAAKGAGYMTDASASDDRVLFELDPDRRIATITLNNPKQRNSYDAAMREAVARCLDRVADDDDITVVLLRGAGGVFSTGADMNNAYGWYGQKGAAGQDDSAAKRRPSQRRRLTVDRKSFSFYHNFMGFPKVTVGEIAGYALGGGFEMALMTDISVIARDTKIGMPATRFLGPALGSLHMFFHRLGPVLSRRLLLTGDIIEAGELEHLGIFTDTCDPGAVTARARYWAEKAAKMPADGVVIAKEAFRLVEQSQAYNGEEVASYLFHAYGTNLQFGPDEFNFVKTRAQHGTKEAFRLRDEHFHVPEPEA